MPGCHIGGCIVGGCIAGGTGCCCCSKRGAGGICGCFGASAGPCALELAAPGVSSASLGAVLAYLPKPFRCAYLGNLCSAICTCIVQGVQSKMRRCDYIHDEPHHHQAMMHCIILGYVRSTMTHCIMFGTGVNSALQQYYTNVDLQLRLQPICFHSM